MRTGALRLIWSNPTETPCGDGISFSKWQSINHRKQRKDVVYAGTIDVQKNVDCKQKLSFVKPTKEKIRTNETSITCFFLILNTHKDKEVIVNTNMNVKAIPKTQKSGFNATLFPGAQNKELLLFVSFDYCL